MKEELNNDTIVPPKDLSNVICPQCNKSFRLTWDYALDKPATLVIRSCPSGGIYDVSINCPYCNYEEPL